ncbi:hypothetical protein D3C84_555480 [compost metagenome]
MLLPNSAELRPLGPEFAHILPMVEGMIEGAQPLAVIGGQGLQIVVEEVRQLDEVGLLFLLIDVPQEGPCRPLGSHEGVFAAHQVEIAAPQQPIVARLARHRQQLDGKLARLKQIPRPGRADGTLKTCAAEHVVEGATERQQQGDRGGALAPALDQAFQRLALVGEEAYPQLVLRLGRQPQAGPVGGKASLVLLPAIPLCHQPLLAQQATGSGGEAREEEVFVEAQLAHPLGGGEAVTILDPGFGTEVFQIDPAGGRALLGHAFDEGGGQLAGKGFYDHLGRDGIRWQGALPALDVNSLNPLAIQRGIKPRADAGEARQVVHPEPHLSMPFPLQLAG